MRKGITVILVGILLSLVMPFSIYASTQNIIVPTYSSSSTESTWSSHLHVENYCEGTNASTNSCILKFTVDDNYYGMISFDAYNGNTMWINYQNVFIAGGYGEYHYNFWSNGQIVMNKVNINAVSLVLPDSNVDLTQIIQLLTAIEQDTSSLDILVNQTKTQIINVLNQLVISNGYLETLTELRKYNFPIESFTFNMSMFYRGYEIMDIWNNGYYTYPMFKIEQNDVLIQNSLPANLTYTIIFFIGKDVSINSWNNYFSIDSQFTITAKTLNYASYPQSSYLNGYFYKLMRFDITNNTSSAIQCEMKYINSSWTEIIPIYFQRTDLPFQVSTDFALNYGLSNSFLDNIQIIANGTTQSNSAASGLEQNNNQMASDINSLATIESGYNQDFNSQMQNIDFSNPITNNQGLLPAANFVITVFNGLINNNPLSVLIIVCCILLIGKRVIGK